MAETNSPNYCQQCGNALSPGGKFCGVCGARVAPVTPEDPQVVPRPAAAAQTAPTYSNRRLLIAGLVSLILLLLVGGGTLALIMNRSADPEVASLSPHPAFDLLLPTLREMTNAPIMLPAELPDDMDIAAIDGYLTDDEQKYGIVFTYGPTEVVAEPPNAQILGTLSAYPGDDDVANQNFDAEEVEDVELSDGTRATLRRMVPAGRAGSQGPFWEGKFDKAGYSYRLMITKTEDITKDEVQQVLSTMIEAE